MSRRLISSPVSCRPLHSHLTRKAFTLIELLVVIAIIAILAAILFPVFSRAREQARKASCASNLKQVGLGVLQYTQDFDELYPIANNTDMTNGAWFQVIQPYLKSTQVLVCPSAGPIVNSGGYGINFCGTTGLVSTGNGFGYRFSSSRCTPNGNSAVSQAEVQEPASTIYAGDPASNGYASNGFLLVAYSDIGYIPTLHGGQNGPFSGGIVAVAPGGGGNYVFADGHVKYMVASQIWRKPIWNINKTNTTGVIP